MWFFILLGILAVCALLYVFRVPLLARALGQTESRVARQLGHRRR